MDDASKRDIDLPGDGEMAGRIRLFDWQATSLGAREAWPGALHYAVEMMLASPQIASVVAGPERILLYNDAAAALYGGRHPDALGRPLPETWPDAWKDVRHHYDRVFDGQSVYVPAQPLDVERPGAGQVFEAYLTPVRDAIGAVIAAHMTGFEVGAKFRMEAALRASQAKLAEDLADMQILRRISGSLIDEGSTEAVCEHILDGARALMRSDCASLQIFVRERNELVLLAHRGFAPESARHWHRVSLSHRTSCGSAMVRGEMTNITDVEDFADLTGTEDLAQLRRSGIRSVRSTPLVSRGGNLVGMISTHWRDVHEPGERELRLFDVVARQAADVIEHRIGDQALRDSEARFRALVTAGAASVYRMSPDWRTMYQLDSETLAVTADPIDGWVDKYIPEQDRPRVSAAIDQAIRTKSLFELEHRVQLADGQTGWVLSRAIPLLGPDDEIVEWFGTGRDMTELRKATERERVSEQRLRILMEGIPQLVWRSCARGRWTWASPQWIDFTGQGQNESHGLGWLDAVHPGDRDATMRAWKAARSHGMLDVEFRVRRVADDSWLWHHTRSVPVHDDDGMIVEWLGTTTDIHGLRELQERQGVLVAELQHRTRNLITVVGSLSDRTVGNAASLDDFKDRFGHRLAALARVQGLLSHLSAGERVDFDELLRSELAALGVVDGKAERVTLDGPTAVPLRSATVQTFALALHELATNAVKYGALAADASDARLLVRWRVEPATGDNSPLLLVEWRESGVTMPPSAASARGSGYGRELIERALPYQLGAETTYALGNDGVRCTIEMRISREGSHPD